MAVDQRFIIRQIQEKSEIFAIFHIATKQPFMECDAESFDDQTYFFASESDAKQFCMDLKEMHACCVMKVEKKDMLNYFTSLSLIGVNRVVYNNGAGSSFIELEQIIKLKKQEEDPKKPPHVNAGLQLTMIYFLQELRRVDAKKDDPERIKKLQELEEEMRVNMERSRFISLLQPVEGVLDENGRQKMNVVIIKNNQGDVFQPIFSDMWECQRFISRNKMKVVLGVVPYEGLKKTLVPESKGYIINPADVNLVLFKERL